MVRLWQALDHYIPKLFVLSQMLVTPHTITDVNNVIDVLDVHCSASRPVELKYNSTENRENTHLMLLHKLI